MERTGTTAVRPATRLVALSVMCLRCLHAAQIRAAASSRKQGAGTMTAVHSPVMLAETLDLLRVQPGGRYLDATVGLGGHAAAILRASAPDGRLLGTDADPEALKTANCNLDAFADRVILQQAWLDDAPQAVRAGGFFPLDGVLCDLGVSSLQLDTPQRGFSFQHDAPLDMRLGPSADTPSAHQIVNEWSTDELADLIYEYGEDRRARRLARAIVQRRPIHTTGELADAVLAAVGRRPGARLHPATRVFQAIRLEVNRELERLAAFLAQVGSILRRGGRLVVIAFHSLEDRLVKRWLRGDGAQHFRDLTRRVRRPTTAETSQNPRARSARLRAAEAI